MYILFGCKTGLLVFYSILLIKQSASARGELIGFKWGRITVCFHEYNWIKPGVQDYITEVSTPGMQLRSSSGTDFGK